MINVFELVCFFGGQVVSDVHTHTHAPVTTITIIMSVVVWNAFGEATQAAYRERLTWVDKICGNWSDRNVLPAIILAQDVHGKCFDVAFKKYFPNSQPHPGDHTLAAIYCRENVAVRHITTDELDVLSPASNKSTMGTAGRIECCIVDDTTLVVSWMGFSPQDFKWQDHRKSTRSMMKYVKMLESRFHCDSVIIGGYFHTNMEELSKEVKTEGYHVLYTRVDQPMCVMTKNIQLAGMVEQPQIEAKGGEPLTGFKYYPIVYNKLLTHASKKDDDDDVPLIRKLRKQPQRRSGDAVSMGYPQPPPQQPPPPPPSSSGNSTTRWRGQPERTDSRCLDTASLGGASSRSRRSYNAEFSGQKLDRTTSELHIDSHPTRLGAAMSELTINKKIRPLSLRRSKKNEIQRTADTMDMLHSKGALEPMSVDDICQQFRDYPNVVSRFMKQTNKTQYGAPIFMFIATLMSMCDGDCATANKVKDIYDDLNPRQTESDDDDDYADRDADYYCEDDDDDDDDEAHH